MASNNNPFAFEKSFTYATSADIHDVARTLESLHEEPGGCLRSSWLEISVYSLREGYGLSAERKQRTRHGTSTSATASGSLREDDGRVIVDISAAIDAGSFYLTLGIIGVVTLFISLSMGEIAGLMLLPMFGLMLLATYISYRARDDLYNRLVGVITSFRAYSSPAATRAAAKAKHTLANDAPQKPSVWDEAISEYEDDRR